MIGSIAARRWNRFLALRFSLVFLDPFPASGISMRVSPTQRFPR